VSIRRQPLIRIARNDLQQLLEPCGPLCSRNAKLGQVRPQSIDHLGPLAHQQIARAMQHQPALLLGRFDLHETHGRTPDRLADRLGVGGIVLVALDVGLHVLRRHQPNLVTELRQLARPIVCRGAGLHADETRRQRFEERQHLAAPKLLPNNDLLGRVDPVDLKHVLGDIQPDRGNLHLDGSPHVIRLRRSLYGTSMPGAGAVHHINCRLWRVQTPNSSLSVRPVVALAWVMARSSALFFGSEKPCAVPL
jgi:hypothetical protein